MSKKKKSDIHIEKLSAIQRGFVVRQCRELGSIEAVRKFYNRLDAVSEYAWLVAQGLFKR